VINRLLDEAICRGLTNDHALDDIVRLRAALDADGAVDAAMAETLSYLESYRARAEEDVNRVKRFVDGLPVRVKVAFAPEIRPGTPSLAALARLANFLIAPQAIGERRARGANAAAAPPKARAPLKSGRRAEKKSATKSDGGIGRMPE
jgi:hypothetical protein